MSNRQNGTMFWTSLLLLGLFAVTSLAPEAKSKVITSAQKLLDLASDVQGELLDALNQHIYREYGNLQKLSTLLNERSKEFHLQPPEVHRELAKHPNGVYLLLKLFSRTWLNHLDAVPSFNLSLHKLYSRIPSHKDFTEAKQGLLRLQRVYRLNVIDMYNGNYSSVLGPPLTPQDAFDIGKQAFTQGYLPESYEWLKLAVEKMRGDEETGQRGERLVTSSKSLARAWSLLGRVYFHRNDTENAQLAYEESMKLDSSNADGVLLGKNLRGEQNTTYSQTYLAYEEELIQLCGRHRDHRVADIRPYHVCRLKESLFLPYLRYKEEILSLVPYVSVFYDIVSDAEIRAIQNFIKGKANFMGRAMVRGGNVSTISNDRVADVCWLKDSDIPLVETLTRKVKDVTRLETDHKSNSAEELQVVHYGLAGQYEAHLDSDSDKIGTPLIRTATFLIYLTDVEKGGYTVFVKAGISVAPLKGMALLWYNTEPHMQSISPLTRHAGCPVLYGQKWIATKWIRAKGAVIRRPCGSHENATQMEVEQLVQSRDTAIRLRVAQASHRHSVHSESILTSTNQSHERA